MNGKALDGLLPGGIDGRMFRCPSLVPSENYNFVMDELHKWLIICLTLLYKVLFCWVVVSTK